MIQEEKKILAQAHLSKKALPILTYTTEYQLFSTQLLKLAPIFLSEDMTTKKTQQKSSEIKKSSSGATYNSTLWASDNKSPHNATTAIKQQAEKQLELAAEKAKKHEERSSQIATSTPNSPTENNEQPEQIYLKTDNESISIPIRKIPSSRFLYIAYQHTNKNITSDDLEKYKSLLEDGRTLSRNSLGQSGIKLYGAWIALKKATEGDRLICSLAEIPNSTMKVYFPLALVDHKEYGNIIKDPRKLGKYDDLLPDKKLLYDAENLEQNDMALPKSPSPSQT